MNGSSVDSAEFSWLPSKLVLTEINKAGFSALRHPTWALHGAADTFSVFVESSALQPNRLL